MRRHEHVNKYFHKRLLTQKGLFRQLITLGLKFVEQKINQEADIYYEVTLNLLKSVFETLNVFICLVFNNRNTD